MLIRRLACVLVAGVCVGTGLASRDRAQTAASPVVVIDHPGPTTALSGRETLRAHLEPTSVRVASMTFHVDGKLICHVVQPPFQCIFDAGLRAQTRTVQVVAVLADKRQVTSEMRAVPPEASRDRGESRIVRVPLVLSAVRGGPVEPIAAESLELLEDKIAQPVLSLVHQNLPLDIAVAVDISSSMEPVLPAVRVALNEFLSSVRDADTARLFTFSDRLNEVVRTRSWSAALDDVVPRGPTALYDGVIEAIDRLNTHPARRVLVVFADADDRHSRASVTTVRERALGQDAALYFVLLAPDRSPRAAREALDDLAVASGGRTILAPAAQLRRVFQELRAELSQLHLLTYASPRSTADGREHAIEVRIKDRRDLRIRTRTRYLDAK